jgi:hypothetical protein
VSLFIQQHFDPYNQTKINAPFGAQQSITLQPNQIPIWLSFLPRKPCDPACLDEQPPPSAFFFGAIFDNGHGHTLALACRHLNLTMSDLTEFIDPKHSLSLRSTHGDQLPIPRLIGDLWIHSNLYADSDSKSKAIRFSLGIRGIACYPDQMTIRLPDGRDEQRTCGPRIPILGGLPLIDVEMDVLLKFSMRKHTKSAIAEFYCP